MVKVKDFLKLTKKQCTEFGLVAILVCIFFALYLHEDNFVVASFILTLITIIVPILFYPFAVLWFGLSYVLSAVSSRIMMSVVFFLMVIPVGLFRRISGKDSLRLRQFKKGKKSVMIERNHVYTEADLLNTF